VHKVPEREYIEPTAARTWYESRRPREDAAGEPLRSAL
jgi:hypothetical protein